MCYISMEASSLLHSWFPSGCGYFVFINFKVCHRGISWTPLTSWLRNPGDNAPYIHSSSHWNVWVNCTRHLVSALLLHGPLSSTYSFSAVGWLQKSAVPGAQETTLQRPSVSEATSETCLCFIYSSCFHWWIYFLSEHLAKWFAVGNQIYSYV